jgi:AraC-like DNA-binding protein
MLESRPLVASDRLVFASDLVRIGAFRCRPDDPDFADSGPARHDCFVFPRTAVAIHHEHEPAFVANSNVVTFYDRGVPYRRRAISARGDHCDWFAVDRDVVRDIVSTLDPAAPHAGRRVFPCSRALADGRTYLQQRRLVDALLVRQPLEPLAVEEMVILLLEHVVRAACRGRRAVTPRAVGNRQRSFVFEVEQLLSASWDAGVRLSALAATVGVSVYHLCRTFRRVTGLTLHQYRHRLRVRSALELVRESSGSLVSIAFDAGFSSHSHFTAAFRQEFGVTPSQLRPLP